MLRYIPLGVNGFTFAVGFFGYALATPRGFSMVEKSLFLGRGVAHADDFSRMVLGVRGLSKSLKALTLLYGGL